MNLFDGAEVCELVEIFILNKLSNIVNKKSVGFNHDDGLGVFGKFSVPKTEQRKKKNNFTCVFITPLKYCKAQYKKNIKLQHSSFCTFGDAFRVLGFSLMIFQMN